MGYTFAAWHILFFQNVVYIENQGSASEGKFELNPNHSHYIIVKSSPSDTVFRDFTPDLIQIFTKGASFCKSGGNSKGMSN